MAGYYRAAIKRRHRSTHRSIICRTARLIIQNDIGETDAHVVVIAVEAETITVTYVDVHLARARFFTALFLGFSVTWSGLNRKSAEGLGGPLDAIITVFVQFHE